MRRYLVTVVFFVLVLFVLTACGQHPSEASTTSQVSAQTADAALGVASPHGGTPEIRPTPTVRRQPATATPTPPVPTPTATPTAVLPTATPTISPNMPLGVAFGPVYEPRNLEHFMDYIHDLGLHRTKVSFYWSDLEPEPDQFDFHLLDTYLDQLGPDDKVLVNLFTNGWCTHAKEEKSIKGATLRECPKGMSSCTKTCEDYYREFVVRVAERVRDRAHDGVAYFQRDTEPASGLHFPADKAKEYVDIQRIFYPAVKSVLPDVTVIGVNQNGNFTNHGMGEPRSRQFFLYVLQHMKDYYDALDVRLYEEYLTIPHRVEWFRNGMQANGYEKPIVSTEHGGPDPRTMHDGDHYLFDELFQQLHALCHSDDMAQSNRCIRRWMREHRDEVSPKLRPFFNVGSEEENAFLEVIHCHDIVQRNLVMLAAGVQATWWWNLQSPGQDFIFGQMRLRDRDMNELPGYGCYKGLVRQMNGVSRVRQLDAGAEDIFLFAVEKEDGSTMYVAWRRDPRLDPWDSAKAAPREAALPIPFPWVHISDLDGHEEVLDTHDGVLRVPLGDTPIFIVEEPSSSIPKPVASPRPVTATPVPTSTPEPTPTPVPTSAPTPTPVQASVTPQVGLNFIRFYFADDERFQPDYIFRDFQNLGVQAIRQLVKADVAWDNVEPRDNEWHFDLADSVIFNSPVAIIATVFEAQYASPSPPWCDSPDEFQKTLGPEAIDYLTHVAERYGPYVKYWTIGNEMEHWRAADPDDPHHDRLPECHPLDGFSPQEQGRFLAQAARVIREHDPDAVILMPGIGGLDDYALNEWFAGVLEGGGSDWFDIVNYHYYGPWMSYPQRREHFAAFLREHGLADKPVWMTETGSTSSPTLTIRTDYPNSPESQAADVFRRLVQAWAAGDQLASWHTYISSPDNPKNIWRGYGIRDEHANPKPAYYSYRLLTRELVPFREVEGVHVDPRGTNVYRITTRSGAVKYVVWGTGTYRVPEGVTEMTSVVPDASGTFAWQRVTPGMTLSLSAIPILLH